MHKGVCAAFLAAFVFSVAPAAAQRAPFTEETVAITTAAGHLAGTLTLPQGPGPFPTALIIAGSGPVDRDGNVRGVSSDAYKKLAYALAQHGIATLRYDKRGVGLSSAQSEADLRFEDYVNDALSVTAFLERDKRVRSVSIIGHSEGSLIGTLAAQRDPHVRGFVSLEGPGRNLATIVDEQVAATPNNPPSIVKEVRDIDASLLAGKLVANPDPLLAAFFRPSVQPYLISEYKYDPAKEMAKLSTPVLIVHGTTDLQVGGVDESLLLAADPRAKSLVIDGMNHMLVDAPADRMSNFATYNEPSLPLDATLVSQLAQFLNG